MSDDFAMRRKLQEVLAYRELCRDVRRSGRENAFFAAVMLFLAYMAWDRGANPLVLGIYSLFIVGELAIGLFKWLFPSAEGHLLDGFVVLAFAGLYLGVQLLAAQGGQPLSPIIVFLGLYMLLAAFSRFKRYAQLRRMFAERPSREHMAWFDELAAEILAADPHADELALDLPTQPRWKAKLLGTTCFFVATRGNTVIIAGPEDFELLREKTDHGTGRRKAFFTVYAVPHPEFQIDDATWNNYVKWRTAHPMSSTAIESETT